MTLRKKRWAPGLCWMCRTADQLVTFIGPVTVNGLTAPGFACRGCCEWSGWYVRAYNAKLDTSEPHSMASEAVTKDRRSVP